MNLKELSEHLKLSQTTVSRALNGYPEVRESTRQRVHEAARKLNYSPNSRAQSLATGRSMLIGHVIPVSNQHEMVNPIFGDFIAGASQAYARHGYGMIISLVEDGDEATAYRTLATKSQVDGIIVHSPRMNDERVDLLNDIGLPFVVHGRATGVTASYSWVDVNNRRAFERATDFLIDLGHERIALINGLEHMDFANRRRIGYEAAHEKRGISIDPVLMRSSEMDEVFGHHQTLDMLRLANPPTAILAGSMITAIGVRRAIQEFGLQMGTDVSVVTFDDDLSYLRNGTDVPIFTATRSSVREAGTRSAEMLIDRINNPDTPAQTFMLEAELLVGRSTGPAPTSG
jgi:LacI family transcriptional regulator